MNKILIGACALVVSFLVVPITTLAAETPENLEGVWITKDGTERWEFETLGRSTSDAEAYPNAIVGLVTVTNLTSGYSQYYGWSYKHYSYFIQWTYNNYHAHSIDRLLDGGIHVSYAEYIGMDLIAPKCVYHGRRWLIEPRYLHRPEPSDGE